MKKKNVRFFFFNRIKNKLMNPMCWHIINNVDCGPYDSLKYFKVRRLF